jgi:tRNA(Ile)-lysidine synthase
VISTALGGPGYEIVERARDSIRRYGMLRTGETVVVAVSGGPDSMCLLDVMSRLTSVFDLALEVAHVDHGLSAESGEVAARVSHAAAEPGYDAHVMRIQDLEGPNLQARARELRYKFFETVARGAGATHILTGHTLDDRVETTLARLIHGAGTSGLAGIPPLEGMRARPLIECRRWETRAYCEERELPFYDDPANSNEHFERVAVRDKIVAAIEDHWGSGAVKAVAGSSERLREDASALEGIADRLYGDLAKIEENEVSLERAALNALPRALQRRVLESAVGRLRDRSGGIEAVLDALSDVGRKDLRFSVAAGAEVEVGAERVTVYRSPGS